MFTSLSRLAASRGRLARLAMAGVVVLIPAPAAVAEVLPSTSTTALLYTTADGAWKVNMVADAAAKAAGRADFVEYVTIDGLGFTGMEMCRLGFNPDKSPVTGTNALGETTFSVTMLSASHGTWKATGNFNIAYTTMTGTLTWTKDGVAYKYTFTGARYTPAPEEYES
jgi:hypothetical protein